MTCQTLIGGQEGKEDGHKKKGKKSKGRILSYENAPFDFFENFQNWQFGSDNFSVKTAPAETRPFLDSESSTTCKLKSQSSNMKTGQSFDKKELG